MGYVLVLLDCLTVAVVDTKTAGSWEFTILNVEDTALYNILASAGLE